MHACEMIMRVVQIGTIEALSSRVTALEAS